MNPSRQSNNAVPEQLLRTAAAQLGVTTESIQNAAQNGSVDALLRNMRPEDAEKLRAVMADRNATAQILASPQAQALLQKLFGTAK